MVMKDKPYIYTAVSQECIRRMIFDTDVGGMNIEIS